LFIYFVTFLYTAICDEIKKDLQAFQDEMVAKQPDYDKLIGRYIPRKSHLPTKKSPRGKPVKSNFFVFGICMRIYHCEVTF